MCCSRRSMSASARDIDQIFTTAAKCRADVKIMMKPSHIGSPAASANTGAEKKYSPVGVIDASSAGREPEFTIAPFTIVPDHTSEAQASPHGPEYIACSNPSALNTKVPAEIAARIAR